MKFPRRSVLIASVLLLVSAGLILYIRSGVSDAIAFNSPHLLNLRAAWLRDGAPEPPPIKKYVSGWTEPNRFMLLTNSYSLDGRKLEGLFVMEDRRFEGRGTLAVTRTGEILWMDSRDGPHQVKPGH